MLEICFEDLTSVFLYDICSLSSEERHTCPSVCRQVESLTDAAWNRSTHGHGTLADLAYRHE